MGIAHSHSSGEEQGELQFTKVESEPQKVGIFCPGEQGISFSLTFRKVYSLSTN